MTIDGTSLTLTEVNDAKRTFGIMLIKYTREHINLVKKANGAMVNIEVDMVGKYVEKSVVACLGEGGSAIRELVEKIVNDVVTRRLAA